MAALLREQTLAVVVVVQRGRVAPEKMVAGLSLAPLAMARAAVAAMEDRLQRAARTQQRPPLVRVEMATAARVAVLLQAVLQRLAQAAVARVVPAAQRLLAATGRLIRLRRGGATRTALAVEVAAAAVRLLPMALLVVLPVERVRAVAAVGSERRVLALAPLVVRD
jgi:hypothetical protein